MLQTGIHSTAGGRRRLAGMTTPTDALYELRGAAEDGRLAGLCERFALDLVVAFGSAVDAASTSEPRDLDIAILPRHPEQLDLMRVATAFVDLIHLDRIDVLDLATAGVLARARALGDGEPLYESIVGLFAREQIRAVSMAMESGWLTDLELELLADA